MYIHKMGLKPNRCLNLQAQFNMYIHKMGLQTNARKNLK